MPFPEKQPILVNQVLHGYNDGHRLLKTSISLDSETERMLLLLSDMSGPSMVKGFESYLTGYPLPNISCYALAKTWSAPEMKRPGCVWTHTLLIKFSDLAYISNLASLVDLFSRPKDQNDLDIYKDIRKLGEDKEIESISERNIEDKDALNQRFYLAAILESLYNRGNKNIFVVSNNSDEYERLTLAIWSQQWPRLRRSFHFCTGSLFIRKAWRKVFDFQIIPSANLPQIRESMKNGIIIGQKEPKLFEAFPKWINICINDLLVKPNGLFRRFLNEFGSEHREGRSVFRPLVEIYQYGVGFDLSNAMPKSIVQKIANEFPDPNSAQSLKNMLFEIKDDQENWFHAFEFSPILLLNEIIDLGPSKAYINQISSIRNLVKTAWTYELKEILSLISIFPNKILNLYEKEVLDEISNLIYGDNLLKVLNANERLAPLLVNNNLKLATRKEVWALSEEIQEKIIDNIINKIEPNILAYKKVIFAIIDVGEKKLIGKLITTHPVNTIQLLLERIDSLKTVESGIDFEYWVGLLKPHSNIILNLLPNLSLKNPITLGIVLNCLDPKSNVMEKVGVNIWIPLLDAGEKDLGRKFNIRTQVDLLILAINTRSNDGAILASKTFNYVHHILMGGRLNDNIWGLLDKELPSVSLWQYWDKCERLRLSLLKCFVKYEWPSEYFIRVFSDLFILEKVFNSNNLHKGEKDILKGIKKMVKEEILKVNPDQRRIILNKKGKKF